MEKFLQDLKEFMIKEEKSEGKGKFSACNYYSVIDQHKDEMKDVIDDIVNYDYSFQYEDDETGGYTEGKINIYLEKDNGKTYVYERMASHHYEISLDIDERMWGYCQCTSEDEGYDPIHNCCGDGCDWYAPAISITRIEGIDYFKFDGVKKDLWKLQREWHGNEDELKKKQNEQQVARIEEQIADLEKRKQLLLHNG